MRERPLLTEGELARLRELGYDWFKPDHYDCNIAEAYRAGVRDGITAAGRVAPDVDASDYNRRKP